MIKISIITVTLNSIQFLPDALESIRMQSYSNIEYIVIDGGSTDGTIDVLRKTNLVSHFVSEKDEGIYDALNKGIRMATGDVIGILHSSDLFASNQTLQNIRDVFASNTLSSGEQKRIDVVYGDLVYVDAEDTDTITRSWVSQAFKPKLINRGWMPPHPTVFIRSEIFKKHGLYDLKYKIAADYDYLIRLFNDNNLTTYYLPKVITKMRVGGISNNGINNLVCKSKEDYKIIRNHKISLPLWVLFLKNISKIPQLAFNKTITNRLRNAGRQLEPGIPNTLRSLAFQDQAST